MADIKESIIKETTKLIEEKNGDLKSVTARAIAKRCGIALGLINYHFKSKDRLIELCVQRIVNRILFCFCSQDDDLGAENDCERLINQARQIFDFFYENKTMAKIFIISDFKDYTPKSNTTAARNGLALAIKDNPDKRKKRIISFILTSALQTAFLTGSHSKDIVGYDLDDKLQRDMFVTEAVNMMFYGM